MAQRVSKTPRRRRLGSGVLACPEGDTIPPVGEGWTGSLGGLGLSAGIARSNKASNNTGS